MKIAVIGNSALSLLNFRGPLLAEMRQRGLEVLAFAPDHDDVSRSTLLNMGVQAIDFSMSRAGTNPIRDGATLINLVRLLRYHRPDMCFSYFIKPVIYGSIAAWLAGVPHRYAMIEGLGYAFTPSGKEGLRKRSLKLLISALMFFAASRVKRLIFLNKDDRDEFITLGLVKRDRTATLGGIGVDLNDWNFCAPVLRPVTFIMVARLLLEKGISDYVNAARILRDDYKEVRFLLLGGLDENPGGIALQTIEAWEAKNYIEWYGHVPVKPWLQKSSVFVLPSYREGVPRSTQEAMSVGLPIITTDVPGCRETVECGKNGFLVPPRDPSALAEAMRQFIMTPSLISIMGAESRKIAERDFDVRKQNIKLLKLMNV